MLIILNRLDYVEAPVEALAEKVHPEGTPEALKDAPPVKKEHKLVDAGLIYVRHDAIAALHAMEEADVKGSTVVLNSGDAFNVTQSLPEIVRQINTAV